MVEIIKSETFSIWLNGLKDRQGKVRILARLDRMELGNPGQFKPVGEGVSEMKIDFGPGYRVYFVNEDGQVVVLLCGGDKSTQKSDIVTAKRMAAERRK